MSLITPTLLSTPAPGKPGKFLVIASVGTAEIHRDVIDLNSAPARGRFVKGVMKCAYRAVTEVDWPVDIQEELNRQLLVLAAVPPGEPEPPEDVPDAGTVNDPRVPALEAMDQEVREAASALLEDPNLLRRISDDIAAVGVEGERRLALTVYLVGVSAQLPKPLSAIVRGLTSSGKSYVVTKVASLFPKEIVLGATSMTTNSLYYFEDGELVHRFVVTGERSRKEDDDRAEATRALREMQEAGRLSKVVPVKEGDRIVTRVIEQEGPIAFVETTTLTKIFAEDLNRCLPLATDESDSQTRRILDVTALAASGQAGPDVRQIQDVHFALQRMLPRTDVVIPFALALARLFEIAGGESRRRFPQLLQLVKASALLHFRQRTRDAKERIVADRRDYQVAARLAAAPLTAARGGVDVAVHKFFAALVAKFKSQSFTTQQARTAGGVSKSTTCARLEVLVEKSVAEQIEPPRGSVPARWQLTQQTLPTQADGLPTMDAVSNWLADCARQRSTA